MSTSSGGGRAAARAAACILIVFAIVSIAEAADDVTARCLVNYPKNPRRANIYYRSHSHDLTLQVSRRLTSRMATNVFKIFLEEVLGYHRVKIVFDESSDTSNLFKSLSPKIQNGVPNAMINLEVFITPEFDFRGHLDWYQVTDCGFVAPLSRFGWFVPEALVNRSDNGPVSWNYFLKQENVKDYNIRGEEFEILKKYAFDDVIGKYYCHEPFCEDGMFVPPQCQSLAGIQQPCALMLAPFTDTTKFIVDHILELNVYIKVIWIGSNIIDAVNILNDKFLSESATRSVIILSWSPVYSRSPNIKFRSLLMPPCETLKSSHVVGCKYELTKIVKLAWSKLKVIGRPVFEAVHKMQFSRNEFADLAKYHIKNSNKADEISACQWMSDNAHIWNRWIPNYKDELYIGGIFPLTGASYNAKGIVIAAKMAQDAINANASILPDYNLTLFVHDGQCRPDMVMKTFFDYIVDNYYDKLLGVLGPACSETVEPLAGISKHYKTVVISYSAEGSSFSDRTKYPYFFRTIGENRQYKYVYLDLLKRLGWNRVAALTEDGQKYTEYISYTEALLQQNKIHFIANSKFPREHDKATLTRYLSELKRQGARVVIADVYESAARAVVCEARRLHMTARDGYVWFLPLWLSTRWYNTTHYNQYFNETTDCTLPEMIEAINGHFALTHSAYAPDAQSMEEGMTVRQWRSNYENLCDNYSKRMKNPDVINPYTALNEKDITSDYAGYAYDAVWTYALAVDQLLKQTPEAVSDIHSNKNTQRLVKIIGDTNFNGVSGQIRFRGGPSRFSVVNVVQWVNMEIRVVGSYYPNVSEDKPEIIGRRLELNESAIVWLTPDGKRPDDGSQTPPTCAFQGLADFLGISCSDVIIVVNVLGFAFLATILISAFFYLKSRYAKRIKLTEKYMKAIGLDMLSSAHMSNLDKWEIPRERVVINRKLGEGAFGTVYGGEAFFPERKGWTAVAVKTLKVGSNTEEKLDFLSEAESMKRFDHKNIIKLLAVCTKNEPVYTVMEFMLYGDLKTYLLARRHLVNKKYSEETEEISSKKLTGMALDVARALSYLANLKYVHRDVACRNCLVNSHRVVKLADFGMTRMIFNNDYYKFTRKGMLPVRWMAPESLGLGIFTAASDVWSYGVLLYEIITFGSFPFQGLSNNQVLEFVKAGHYITIPSGVKPQLEGLMKSCWNLEHKTRPQASEIAEFLANNPRLLSPCLDVPLSSVEVDHTDQLEILPEDIRKCSMSVLVSDLPPSPSTDSTYFTSELDYGPNYTQMTSNDRADPNEDSYEKDYLAPEEISFL